MTAPKEKHSTQPFSQATGLPPPGFAYALWVAALLGNLHDAGFAVDTCVAGQDRDSLFSTQLTRQQVLQCLRVMSNSAADLPPAIRALLPDIDWAAFHQLDTLLSARGNQQQALWEAMTELVPNTLRALNRYRKHKPTLFSFRADL